MLSRKKKKDKTNDPPPPTGSSDPDSKFSRALQRAQAIKGQKGEKGKEGGKGEGKPSSSNISAGKGNNTGAQAASVAPPPPPSVAPPPPPSPEALAEAIEKNEKNPRDNGYKHRPLEHQQRNCEAGHLCLAPDGKGPWHWRHMLWNWRTDCANKAVESRVGTAAEIGDVLDGAQEDHRVHWCIYCVMHFYGLTMAEANVMIRQRPNEKSMLRSATFAHAIAHVAKTWDFFMIEKDEEYFFDDDRQVAGASSKRKLAKMRRQLASEVMAEQFAPIAEILALKKLDEEAALEACRKFQKGLKEAEAKGTLTEGEEAGLDKLQEDYESKAHVQRGFAGHDQQQLMRNAADYVDDWFETKGGTPFQVFYVCMAGGTEYPCCTMILSKHWDRLHKGEAWAKGQRWYCHDGHRYMTKFGVLMLLEIGGMCHACRATVPDGDIFDAKMMIIEKNFSHCRTPEELYNAIPDAVPCDKEKFMRPLSKPGHYRFDKNIFAEMPVFQWQQLYNLQTVEDEAHILRAQRIAAMPDSDS